MPPKKPVRVAIGETLTDGQLIRRVLSGEAALFEILVHRHSQRLYRTARAILRDDDEAADVVQETYLRAYRNLKQFAGRASFSTWLTRIAIYEARARIRKSRIRGDKRGAAAAAKAPGEEPATEPDAEKRVLAGEMRAMMEAAIDALPDLYRTVFVMRGVEEMSTDAAECLNLSEDAVKTRLHRARALLRRKLYAAAGPMRREAFRFAGQRCVRMWEEKIRPALSLAGR